MPTHAPTDKKLHFFDPVEKPIHYAAGTVECIDAIEAQLTPEEFRGYLKGAMLKYIWRYTYKDRALEDLLKARWYLDKLIQKVADADNSNSKSNPGH